MSGLETRLVISATDKTAAAFASVEARMKAIDKHASAVAGTVEAVDKVSKSIAPISKRLAEADAQFNKVAAATRALTAEQEKLAAAGARLDTFKQTTASLAAYEKQLGLARDRLREVWGAISSSAEPTKALQREYERAEASVQRLSGAVEQQQSQVLAARAGFEELVGPLDTAAAAEARLAAEAQRVAAAMKQQGAAAAQGAGQLARAAREQEAIERRRQGFAHQFRNEVLPFAGPEIVHGAVKSIEQGADVEQLKFRIGAMGGPAEAAFADTVAGQAAGRYPSVSKAKALDTYLELRANAVNPDGTLNADRAGANLQTAARAQAAASALGVDLTPRDMQNLIKSMESTGRAGDAGAFGKTLDSYLRAKQMYGSAASSESLLTFTQNAKSSNFGLSDDVFYGSLWARLAEGNAARLGNEFSQTMSTLVGGTMTKQGVEWLVNHGLARQDQVKKGGGGKFYIEGGVAGHDMLSADPTTWADTVLLPAIKRSGALDENRIAARAASMRNEEMAKTGRAGDLASYRERAESGLVSDELYKSGWRSTVIDQIAHAIVNSPLINRDTAAMGRLQGSEVADNLGQNPVAAFKELGSAIATFAAAVSGPAVKAAAPALDALSKGIATVSQGIETFSKEHPTAATALSGGGLAGALGAGGWLSYKLLSGFGSALTGGGELKGSAAALIGAAEALDAAAVKLGGEGVLGGGKAAAAAEGAAAGTAGMAARALRVGGALTLPLALGGDTDAGERAWLADHPESRTMAEMLSGLFSGPRRTPPATVKPLGPDYAMPWPEKMYPASSFPSAGGGAQNVSVQAEVTGTAHSETTVTVNAGSALLEIVNKVQHLASEIPLLGHATGRMDSDAAPNRGAHGGIGHN